jgi:hypothetical protein
LRQEDRALVSDAMKADSLHYEAVRIGNSGASVQQTTPTSKPP